MPPNWSFIRDLDDSKVVFGVKVRVVRVYGFPAYNSREEFNSWECIFHDFQLLHLCEAENVSYLDEVASNAASQDMAKSVGLEVLDLLKKMFGIDFTQSNASSEVLYPKGQLELNAMRLADVFSDDSNFRSFIMTCHN